MSAPYYEDDLADVEALAAIIHPHMRRVRDRGDYMIGPASDDAAASILASDWLATYVRDAVSAEASG